MLLTALLLAAAVQAAPVEPPRVVEGQVVPAAKRSCPRGEVTFTLEPKVQQDPVRPLAKEPRSGLRYAVMRSIDGCSVDAPMKVNRRR